MASPPILPSIGQTPAISCQWVRNDTAAKKVLYMRTKVSPWKEEVLYDFSLQTGDTINDSNSSYFAPQKLYPYKAWVDQVDSVYWPDGLWRYRWWIKSLFGYPSPSLAIMIEGFGYTTNFLDNPLDSFYAPIEYSERVVCFQLKKQWLYEIPNVWSTDCDTMITKDVNGLKVEKINELNLPLLYPNPVKTNGLLMLNNYASNVNENCELKAYNLLGQQILNASIKPGGSLPLATYHILPGNYFFTVNNSIQQVIFKGKILVY